MLGLDGIMLEVARRRRALLIWTESQPMRILIFFIVLLLSTSLRAQVPKWSGQDINLLAGLNNGVYKSLISLKAEKGKVPWLSVKFRVMDREELLKEKLDEIAGLVPYEYRGSQRRQDGGNDWLEHRFVTRSGLKLGIAESIVSLGKAPRSFFLLRGFDVVAPALPFAMLILGKGKDEQYSPLRDFGKWAKTVARSLMLDEIPIEASADRKFLFFFYSEKLNKGTPQQQLEVLRQVENLTPSELRKGQNNIISLCNSRHEGVKKAAAALCKKYEIFTYYDLYQATKKLESKDPSAWDKGLYVIEKVGIDNIRITEPALKAFLQKENLLAKTRSRAQKVLESFSAVKAKSATGVAKGGLKGRLRPVSRPVAKRRHPQAALPKSRQAASQPALQTRPSPSQK